jgi:hypothetical protein
MEIDSYWRTRTIAEAQSQGYTHLRVTCAGCGRISDIPWQLLLGRSRVTPESFIGNVPLRCQSCGSTAPTIGVRGGALAR